MDEIYSDLAEAIKENLHGSVEGDFAFVHDKYGSNLIARHFGPDNEFDGREFLVELSFSEIG